MWQLLFKEMLLGGNFLGACPGFLVLSKVQTERGKEKTGNHEEIGRGTQLKTVT